jgi:trimethylamine monooxygenase
MTTFARCLVIGSGCSGLAIARELKDAGIGFVVAERKADIGGLWLYRSTAGEAVPSPDSTDLAQIGASPIYHDLTTNLPKAIMQFHDFSFPTHVPDLPNLSRRSVFDYLAAFCTAHELRRFVEFNTVVTSVSKKRSADWTVTTMTQTEHGQLTETRLFSHVVVASGHYASPMMPEQLLSVPKFPGRVLHSCSFDKSGEFDGKHVLVVGGSVSAGDIASMIQQRGSPASVHIARRKPPTTMFRLLTKKGVEAAQERGCILHEGDVTKLGAGVDNKGIAWLSDGSSIACDAVICATGYAYTFPFLEQAEVDVVGTGGWTVQNLFKGLFYGPDPSISFIGLHNVLIGPCQVFEAQARLVAKVVAGEVSLRSIIEADRLDGREADGTDDRRREIDRQEIDREEIDRQEQQSYRRGDRQQQQPQQMQDSDRPFLGMGTEAYIDELSAISGVPSTYRGFGAKARL